MALAINAGSSSVKCAIFTFEAEPQLVARGTLDGQAQSRLPGLLEWVDAQMPGKSLVAIGHRIVHGGPTYRDPQRIDAAVRNTLKRLVAFAPNHLPDEIALIDALGRWRPQVPQVACFDTAFHADLPEVARRLPIPREYDAQGVRRYGFHGLSFAFLAQELRRLDANGSKGLAIFAHLGNGSSLAAIRDGHSIDTTMAFTPIGGVVMSTRSGDLDPGVATYIARTDKLNADQVEDLLSHRSGLLGISGTTGDMRALLEREPRDSACRLAVTMYAYSIKKAIGALAAALGGLDTLVFSGGIGEHAPIVRARICDGLEFLGIRLDPDRNATDAPVISSLASHVVVRVMPTDEELMIARGTYQLVGPRGETS